MDREISKTNSFDGAGLSGDMTEPEPTAEDIEVGVTKDIPVVVDSGYSYDKYSIELKIGHQDIGGVTIANDGKISIESTKVGKGNYIVYATNSLTARWTSIEVELKNHYVVDFSEFLNDSSINDTAGYNTILGNASKVLRPLIADKAENTAFSFSEDVKFYGYKSGAASFSKPNGNSVSIGGSNGALVTVINDDIFMPGEYYIKAVINVNHASNSNDTGWNITVGDGTKANSTHEDGAVFTSKGDNNINSSKFNVRDGEAVSFASGGSRPTIHKSIKIISNGDLN